MVRSARLVLAPLGAAALMLVGCVAHPVGPARTYAKYEGKAVTTAKSALSAVESARLTADAASQGNTFGPYAATVISEAEESARRVQDTFASVQSPGPRADALSAELDALLAPTVKDLTALRVAARRGELDRLGTVAAPLGEDSSLLQQFIDRHR